MSGPIYLVPTNTPSIKNTAGETCLVDYPKLSAFFCHLSAHLPGAILGCPRPLQDSFWGPILGKISYKFGFHVGPPLGCHFGKPPAPRSGIHLGMKSGMKFGTMCLHFRAAPPLFQSLPLLLLVLRLLLLVLLSILLLFCRCSIITRRPSGCRIGPRP